MNESLHHRGPDDRGIFVDKYKNWGIAFWQDRLSIIDLSLAGHQPMFFLKTHGAWNENHNPQSDYELTIVFNGEIYNYLDIKQELEALWYIFSSHSDTEVLLASYHAWWESCVERFNGMWAFCIYDKQKSLFFCSRDRFGKKPLYYHQTATDFLFSSELKGIISHEDLTINQEGNLDPEALDFYFTTGNIPAPYTIYKNVRKLEAGTNLLISIKGDVISKEIKRYYVLPPFSPSLDKSWLITEWRELLEDAVKIRMFSADVPVWAFLSGGLDSSSVVAEMTKFTEKQNLHTFSIGFEGKYDETPYINIVKEAFGTNHHHEYFKEEDFRKLLGDIYYYYDEPFADYSNFPTLFVSQLARKYVTVALSWDGGDEVFGWYMMHQIAAQMSFLYRIPRFLRKIFYVVIPKIGNELSLLSKLREALRISFFPKEDFYAELGWSFLYRPDIYKTWTRERLKWLLERNNGNFTQSIIDFDLLHNTLGDNFLTKVDRASMSQSLEVRSPFLDYRFVEYARKIPTKWKVNQRKNKILMRDIIRGIVPDTIVNRGKQGFEPPIKEWILSEEYLKEMKDSVIELERRGVLSSEWATFYRQTVLSSYNQAFTVYKIRLFLLMKWKEKWIH